MDKGNVTCITSPIVGKEQTDDTLSISVLSEDNILARELFPSEQVRPWNDLVTEKQQGLILKDLPPVQRTDLLEKYSLSENLTFLRAPRLNPKFKSGLKNYSILERGEFISSNQGQVGTALCAFRKAISELFKPEVQRYLTLEARLAVPKIDEETKILADLFHRLSLSRRVQITPVMVFLAKTTTDNFLLGTSFGKELKKATILEKIFSQ